jgi:putative ABC transport system ATP-binding protein
LRKVARVLMVTHDNRILELADRIVNPVEGIIVSDVVLRDALLICEFLKSAEVFNRLTPSEMANVAECMRRRRYAAGEIVIGEGDVGEEFFLIRSGSASVTAGKAGQPERQLDMLGTGQVIGEIALFSGKPRNATVRAVTELETFYLAQKDFQEALH